MAKKKQEAIENRSTTSVIPFDYGEDVSAGYENQTTEDFTIPFIVLCQASTPAVKDGLARAGDYIDTVTERVWKRDEGIPFVPCTTRHVFSVWVPRNEGGGYRGQLEIDDERVLKAKAESTQFGQYEMWEEDGDGREQRLELRETFYMYGVVLEEDGESIALRGVCFPFWSTKIAAYKQTNTRCNQVARAPLFAHRVRFTSKETRNAEGEFYVPVSKPFDPRGVKASLLAPDSEAFVTAKELRKLILGNQVKIDYSTQEGEGGSSKNGPDDGIPF